MAFPSRWPFAESFPEEVFRSFAPLFEGSRGRSAGVFPPVNLFDDGEKFLVRAELPGVNRDTLDVTAQGDQLTIRGERNIAEAEPNASYHRREREAGQFRRTVALPQAVDSEHVEATYRNGVLEIVLPRAPELKPRKISIH